MPSSTPAMYCSDTPGLHRRMAAVCISYPTLQALSISAISHSSFTERNDTTALISSREACFLVMDARIPVKSSSSIMLS